MEITYVLFGQYLGRKNPDKCHVFPETLSLALVTLGNQLPYRSGTKQTGWVPPRAWPWRASRNTVLTLPARSSPQPRLPAAPAHLLRVVAGPWRKDPPHNGPCPRAPRRKVPCPKVPCPKGPFSTSCSALWMRSQPSDRWSCSSTIFIGSTMRPQPFSYTSAGNSAGAACWCSARIALSPWA